MNFDATPPGDDDRDGAAYRLSYDSGGTEPVSAVVVRAVAAVAGVHSRRLDPLYDSVDPDALDVLFDGRSNGRITFTFADCDVTVHGRGEIVIRTPTDWRFRSTDR